MSRRDPPNTEEVQPNGNLPAGWAAARLDDVAVLINGFAFTPRHWGKTGLPIVRIQNLNNPDAPFNYCQDEMPLKFRITNGELLFAWSGTPGSSFGAHIWQGGDAWLNQHIFKVVFDRDLLNATFLCLAINRNLQSYISSAQGGSGLAHVRRGTVASSQILIAPLTEQVRIIDRIEEMTTEIEDAAGALQRARSNLVRYKATTLISAADGSLTAGWREEKRADKGTPAPSNLSSPASRSQLDLEFGEATSISMAGPDSDNSAGRPRIPQSWRWTTFARAGELTIGRQRSPKHHVGPNMHPYLRVANVFEDRIDTADVLSMNFSPTEFRKYRLENGDILLNEGQSLELVGRAAMYRSEIPNACFQNTLIRFRASPGVLPAYALIVFRAYFHSRRFQRIAKRTTNIAHLSLRRLANLEFPLAPIAEQEQIVEIVTARLAHVSAGERTVAEGLNRSNFLRDQILSQALRGALVKQSANDEPAIVLLERIRQRRAEKLLVEPRKMSGKQTRRQRISMKTTSKKPLLPILQNHPKGLTPEELLVAAGYDLTEIDEFYDKLRAIQTRITEHRSPAPGVYSWPKKATIRLRSKE